MNKKAFTVIAAIAVVFMMLLIPISTLTEGNQNVNNDVKNESGNDMTQPVLSASNIYDTYVFYNGDVEVSR